MKKVLIITYYWPPASSPGVQRWLKFVKYLPEYGWEPIILTVENGSFPGYDEDLEKEIPPHIKVYKAKTWEPFTIYNRLRGKKGNQVEVGGGAFTADDSFIRKLGTYIRSNYFIPDARIGWNRRAYRTAKKIIKEHNIKHVVTTSPPHSSQLIGLKLKKKLNIKWIADLRDPWISMMYNQFLTRTSRSQRIDQAYENKVLKNADHVLVIGGSMKKEFEDRAKNISVITNGYDSADILEDKKEKPFDRFTIFFMGNFLSQQSIASFWQAIFQMNQKYDRLFDTFQFRIIGNISEVVYDDMIYYEIAGLIHTEYYMPHEKVISEMRKSHLLYLPIPYTKGNKMIITGKIFEYLASKLPILAIGPKDGDADWILKKAQRAPIEHYKDQEAVFKRIEDAYLAWKESRTQQIHQNDLHKAYDRKKLTGKVAELLNSL